MGNGIHHWYLAVLLFSLALLTKYNAVLFGVGVFVYVLYYKKQIKSPSYGHLALSVVIMILIQIPVITWNLSNDLASFSFHLNERLDQGKSSLKLFENAAGFLLGLLLAFSPIFILNLKNNYALVGYDDVRNSFIRMSKFVFLFSVTFCLFLTFFTNVLYYWLTPAIVLFFPFFYDIFKFKLWQYLHIFYGMFVALILVINISIYPISAFFGNVDRETAILFGWKDIIEVIEKEKKSRGIEKLVFSDYRLGSLYIFHSEDFKVDVVMEERKTQFDVWRDKENAFAKKALIIADKDFPIGQKILSSFEAIDFVRDIEIYIGNKLIRKYQVFLGTNT